MIDFATLQGLTIPEGVVTQIADASGHVLWKLETSKTIVLEVEKQTITTYAGETEYANESVVLLDIYPKTNGTVSVTYGGLTKTITDTSGAAEPTALQVFFGTFNGVSDSVETPASGTLTIEGDYRCFAIGTYKPSKMANAYCPCITKVKNFGTVEIIPFAAFGNLMGGGCKKITSVTIPSSVTSIGDSAFYLESGNTRTVTMLSATPATLGGENTFDDVGTNNIVVPVGCGDTYKAAENWNKYADYITEAS